MSCLSDDSLSHMIDHPSRTHFTYTSTLLQRDIALNQNASSLVPQFLNMNVALLWYEGFFKDGWVKRYPNLKLHEKTDFYRFRAKKVQMDKKDYPQHYLEKTRLSKFYLKSIFGSIKVNLGVKKSNSVAISKSPLLTFW